MEETFITMTADGRVLANQDGPDFYDGEGHIVSFDGEGRAVGYGEASLKDDDTEGAAKARAAFVAQYGPFYAL